MNFEGLPGHMSGRLRGLRSRAYEREDRRKALLKAKTERAGFEPAVRSPAHWFSKPADENHNHLNSQSLTKTKKCDVATNVDRILSDHPDLIKIIQEWPEMAESTKRGILAAVETTS